MCRLSYGYFRLFGYYDHGIAYFLGLGLASGDAVALGVCYHGCFAYVSSSLTHGFPLRFRFNCWTCLFSWVLIFVCLLLLLCRLCFRFGVGICAGFCGIGCVFVLDLLGFML